MISIIKMDLYRLFKTKSMYIVWGMLTFMIILMNYIVMGVDGSTYMNGVLQNMDQSITLGAVFISVFTVIFATADINSGYIKNIGGQLPRRSILVLSKSFSLLIYTILTMLLVYTVHAIDYWVMGVIPFTITSNDIKSFLIEALLNFALALLCMAISLIIKRTAIAMTISIALGSGILSSAVIYLIVNSIASDLGYDKFDAFDYGLIGNILSAAPGYWSDTYLIRALVTAVVCITAAITISCIIFKKRDIV